MHVGFSNWNGLAEFYYSWICLPVMWYTHMTKGKSLTGWFSSQADMITTKHGRLRCFLTGEFWRKMNLTMYLYFLTRAQTRHPGLHAAWKGAILSTDIDNWITLDRSGPALVLWSRFDCPFSQAPPRLIWHTMHTGAKAYKHVVSCPD